MNTRELPRTFASGLMNTKFRSLVIDAGSG
jgi:hypothetical protein